MPSRVQTSKAIVDATKTRLAHGTEAESVGLSRNHCRAAMVGLWTARVHFFGEVSGTMTCAYAVPAHITQGPPP